MTKEQAAGGLNNKDTNENIIHTDKLPNMTVASKLPAKASKATVVSSIDNKNSDSEEDEIQEKVADNHDDNKPVLCNSPTSARPIGPKRRISSSDLRGKKRSCNQIPNEINENINAAKVRELDPDISVDEANAIVHDFNHALKILKAQSTSEDDSAPSLEYMVQLINEWKPKREIICMYVRWSKRLRRNYHLDSISTLLCIAKQCDYTPHVFLKNIKTLTISLSTTTYGLNFKFDTCKNKAIDGNKLNQKFVGLSITLRLLQSGVVSGSGTFGNVGLKSPPTPRKESGDEIYVTTGSSIDQKYVVAQKPTSRFHTNAGLLGRIWMAIQHRWISIQVVEMLFPAQLAQAKTEQESLAFSFQMHSSAGPTRYDFLDPIIGVCLRFRTTAIIDNHTNILENVWKTPSSFVAFGNGHLQGTTEKDRFRYIAETFIDLQSMMKNWKKVTIHQKTKREVKWQMIRGYAFHFWLEQVKNQKLKAAVDSHCTASNATSTRKSKILPSTLASSKKSATEAIQTVPLCDTRLGREKETKTPSAGGLARLLQTRQVHASSTNEGTAVTASHEERTHVLIADPLQTLQNIDLSSLSWTSLTLASRSEVNSRVSSHLLIRRDDGISLVAELSPLEVYSANMLYKLRHSRLTGPKGFFPPKSEVGSAVLSVEADMDKFVDQSSKTYHVAREDTTYFIEHQNLIPPIEHMVNLCKAVWKYGKHDSSRCSHQFRINIGCGGQHRPNGRPETLVGLSFKASLESDPEFNEEEIISTIGSITEFTWNVMKDMQVDATDGPLAPDPRRHREYARHLSNYLKASNDVGFEDVTVVLGILYPSMPSVTEHIDSMNDSVAGYTRTGAFNVVLTLGKVKDPILLHLQVLCNFRRVIREYILPFNSLLSSIAGNCKHYLAKWQHNMNQVYGGRSPHVPNPFDRKNFFLDDSLPFEIIKISNGSEHRSSVAGQYLLTEISPSRVLSFSMFIDPIVDLNQILCYDQQIELCFIASVLSNPFWFEHTITSLTQKHIDSDDPFYFGVHPLYDWAKETMSIFGAWQGGPHNRWSPFGGSTPFPNLFGAHFDATHQEQANGKIKLEAVIQVLYHHLQWVNSLDETVFDVIHDLPLSVIESHMTSVTEAIFKIVPCQFNAFRLFVFTTLAVGCGLLKHGIHLKALMYPIKGSASFKHLSDPQQDRITRTHALSLCNRQEHLSNVYENDNEGVQSQHHDDLMLYLSQEIGMTRYLRDETECVLCEGHPNRNLQCRDWFKKGRRIFDCDMEGNVIQKEFGMNSEWIKVRTSVPVKFAFLKEVIVYQQIDEVLKDYAMAFGEVLQKNKAAIKFCGRNTRTSDFVQQYSNEYTADLWKEPFSAIRHRAANFYDGGFTRRMDYTTIQVLGDGESPMIVDTDCNDIVRFPDGLCLWKYVLQVLYGATDNHMMYSARYHQHQEDSDQESKTVIFPGHLDKAFVKSVVFLPLTDRDFFTIIAVPQSWFTKQNEESSALFQGWIERVSVEERKMVEDFLQRFKQIAEKYMKIEVRVRVFSCMVGSLLVFPANICFHTTITPGCTIQQLKNPRDIFIIHTTTTTKR